MTTYTHRQAEREAYQAVPETCPEVDHALAVAGGLIKIQTNALRAALVEALERAIVAEERAEELEKEVEALQDMLALAGN